MSGKVVAWVAAGVVAVIGTGAAWLFLAGGSGEPSTELTTPTIVTDTTSGAAAAPSFAIDPGQSTASFQLDEVLRGSQQTVVGRTSEVVGQVVVDPDDLSSVQFSQIVINARTFQTDSSMRDRAIRGPVILNSATDEFELITFDVTAIDGLTDSAAIGDVINFSVTGDLLIRDVTAATTFDVSVTFVDETTITGSTEAVVLRSDFGIGIPNVPSVADVTDEVLIRLEFVATSG